MRTFKYFQISAYVAPAIILALFAVDKFFMEVNLILATAVAFVCLMPLIIVLWADAERVKGRDFLASTYHFLAAFFIAAIFILAAWKAGSQYYGMIPKLIVLLFQLFLMMYIMGKLERFGRSLGKRATEAMA